MTLGIIIVTGKRITYQMESDQGQGGALVSTAPKQTISTELRNLKSIRWLSLTVFIRQMVENELLHDIFYFPGLLSGISFVCRVLHSGCGFLFAIVLCIY